MHFQYSVVLFQILMCLVLPSANRVLSSASTGSSANQYEFYASQHLDNIVSSRTKRQIGRVGSSEDKECDFQSFTSATQICVTLFFDELKRDPKVLCSKVYKKLRRCILSKSSDCSSTNSAKTRINRSVQKSLAYYMEAKYCNDGSLSIARRPINYCRLEYTGAVKNCYNEYHRTFRRNPGDSTLCSLYAESKACALNAENEFCSFTPILKKAREMFENTSRCWNPLCTPDTRNMNYISASEKGLSFSFLLNMIRGKLRLVNRRGIEFFDEYRNARTMKSGVPADCEYNQAVVISTALDQITKDFNPTAKDDPRFLLVSGQNVTTSASRELANIVGAPSRQSQDNGNGAKNLKSLSNYLALLQVITLHIILYNR